ncbi:response regulator transcription factor [Pseudoflavitalea sp. X16]|uniref:LytR/AlgR family response regulator transcription factor n=1 Tax=Paraflavitalea devenefica TaxID=2716334 RepID=UPI0014248359|nr:LytTR family DNA-binding domain-containing protein [Paraflavitalea devenefica]NII28594.1 response regulator transcription factor [Paraflavitalea devenefica]
MKQLTCIIIEDEPLALLRTKEYVEQVPFLHLLQTYNSALKALPALQEQNVDLLFLDIQMEGLTGIQLLQALPQPPLVIFTTAYEAFALKAFELEVVDYLLKPFSFERFLSAVLKVRKRMQSTPQPTPAYLFFKTAWRLEKVDLGDILFIEGARDYRKICCTKDKLLTPETFIELEERLPASLFCRVHKSFIVSLSRIDAVEGDRILIGKERIPVSDTYRATFYKALL